MSRRKKDTDSVSNGLDRGFSLKKIKPLTKNQEATFSAYDNGLNLLLHGVAGTGKTYIALYLALRDYVQMKCKQVVIIRSVVPSRDMGYLPGNMKEKSAMYELPYEIICNELFGRGDAYQILKTKGAINFATTSFERGITRNDAIVIVDEFQNMTFQELDTIITRCGQRCRMLFCGDVEQSDLIRSKYDVSGLPQFVDILVSMDCFETLEFGIDDIVRSGLVKDYIIAKRDLGLHSPLFE